MVPHTFDPDVVAAVLRHMNDDHIEDNLLIARAFGAVDDVHSATMAGFDGDGADWDAVSGAGVARVRVAWPSGPITERAAVRREVVLVYRAACARLGVPARQPE